MIKFFRKIRYKLLSENQFRKYLIYAIGEIVLVVIGILIALSINNWNEHRKLKSNERVLLESFKRSIEGDLRILPRYLSESEVTSKSINILLKCFEQNLPYHDSLKYHFGNTSLPWRPSITQEVFQSLNSTELNLISNNELKAQILSYYKFSNNRLHNYTEKYNSIIENASKDIFCYRFNSLWDNITQSGKIPMIPNDYEALKKDDQYLYFLKSLRNQFDLYIQRPTRAAISRAENLLQKIDNELLNNK